MREGRTGEPELAHTVRVSDMHMHNLYNFTTMISNTETNKSNVQIKFSLLLSKLFLL